MLVWSLVWASSVAGGEPSIVDTIVLDAKCPDYWNSSGATYATLPSRVVEDLRSKETVNPLRPDEYLFSKIDKERRECRPPAALYDMQLDKNVAQLESRISVARERILARYALGTPYPTRGDVKVSYFVLTLPSRLCLAKNVLQQLTVGGAVGDVYLVHGKKLGFDECAESPFGPRRACNKVNVCSASYVDYILPLSYSPEYGGDINIFLEDDAALCVAPSVLVDQASKAPIMWLGYHNEFGAQTYSLWRNATPFVYNRLLPVQHKFCDLFWLRRCLNATRPKWSLASTFSHAKVQRDYEKDPGVVEQGHIWKCTWVRAYHPQYPQVVPTLKVWGADSVDDDFH